MFPNWNYNNGIWGAESYLLGATLLDWRRDFNDLPEEVKAYLSEHENEIRTEQDVDRLVRTYNMKK